MCDNRQNIFIFRTIFFIEQGSQIKLLKKEIISKSCMYVKQVTDDTYFEKSII